MISIILVLISSIIFLLRKRLDLYIYLFLFSILYFPLLLYWQGLYSFKDFVPLILVVMLFLTYYPSVVSTGFFRNTIIRIVAIVFLLITIIFIASSINGYDIYNGLRFFRHEFWGLLLFTILSCTKIPKINLKQLMLFVLISQLVLVALQVLGGSGISEKFLLIEYEKDGETIEGTSASIVELTVENGGYLITGSLCKVTKLANFIALFITFWTGYAMSKKSYLSFFDIIVLALSFGTIFLSGVRAPLVSGFLGFVLCYLFVNYSQKRIIRFFLCSVCVAIAFLPILLTAGKTAFESGAGYDEGINRVLSIFGILSNIGNLDPDNAATLGRSIYMLQFVSWQTILLGTGIWNNNPFGYGSGLASISDCMIVFVIAEYGILVFLLCASFFYLALVRVKKLCLRKDYNIVLILFIVLFVQTIVDQGIFDTLSKYFFYIVAVLVLQDSQKYVHKSNI